MHNFGRVLCILSLFALSACGDSSCKCEEAKTAPMPTGSPAISWAPPAPMEPVPQITASPIADVPLPTIQTHTPWQRLTDTPSPTAPVPFQHAQPPAQPVTQPQWQSLNPAAGQPAAMQAPAPGTIAVPPAFMPMGY